jgi:hypothetical protein
VLGKLLTTIFNLQVVMVFILTLVLFQYDGPAFLLNDTVFLNVVTV